MFNWLWRLTMTEVGVLLILGAIWIYGRRMVSELRRVNHHLRALRNDEDRRLAQAERELLAPGLPRVEVLSSMAAAWSQGGTYAVQISDPAGRPLAGADVLLRAGMADGTVQSMLLHSGREPGTYQATVPGSSAPVDLRVRITTSDKRVEIPLRR
jgi:hypothetical protein